MIKALSNDQQLKDAVALLVRYKRIRAKGEVTFHFDGEGNIGTRATVHIYELMHGESKAEGIEVTLTQVAKVAKKILEAKQANNTTK